MSARTLDDAIAGTLPDAELAGLDPALRAAIARAWREHAASERAEANALARVAAIVTSQPGPSDLHWIALRGAADELRHAAICAHVAHAYDPSLSPALPQARAFTPLLPDIAPAHRRALRVIVQCCVQETLAAAYLEQAHARATEPLARAALRALFSDEIDHGRIGYGYAATLGPEARRALAEVLPVAVDRCVGQWRTRVRSLPDVAAPAHGVLDRATVEATIESAARDLVLPGLRAVELA